MHVVSATSPEEKGQRFNGKRLFGHLVTPGLLQRKHTSIVVSYVTEGAQDDAMATRGLISLPMYACMVSCWFSSLLVPLALPSKSSSREPQHVLGTVVARRSLYSSVSDVIT